MVREFAMLCWTRITNDAMSVFFFGPHGRLLPRLSIVGVSGKWVGCRQMPKIRGSSQLGIRTQVSAHCRVSSFSPSIFRESPHDIWSWLKIKIICGGKKRWKRFCKHCLEENIVIVDSLGIKRINGYASSQQLIAIVLKSQSASWNKW